MSPALILNPGSASLKFELIDVQPDQAIASDSRKILSASIEGIGAQASLVEFDGRAIAARHPCSVSDMAAGASAALHWLRTHARGDLTKDLQFAGVRVVHGGTRFAEPIRLTAEVRKEVEALEELAPLHNKNSLAIAAVLERELPAVPVLAAFDTSFHRTIPEVAWRYPIERGVADRFGIRKFGFHGFSHRYMLEQYARMEGKPPDSVSAITLHLESGCSAAAIRQGKSIDTTMGLTPLEGLMMGTRSGSIDPAIVPLLMRRLNAGPEEVMTLLNRKSGLLGIDGESFDTRELVRKDDPAAKLALEMFSYRVRLAVGAFLAALDAAEAILFGGGIGEDTPLVREQVCGGLDSWGIHLDRAQNARVTAGPASIARPGSRLKICVIAVEEGLQIAHECARVMQKENPSPGG